MFRKTLVLASFAGLLAFSGAAFAQDANTNAPPANSETPGGLEDDTGMATLGINIQDYDAAQGLEAIPADLRDKVQSGCETVVANQANQNAAVLSFCQKLTGQQ